MSTLNKDSLLPLNPMHLPEAPLGFLSLGVGGQALVPLFYLF